MSYASSINPRNWEAIAIFVCFDNFCSAIRSPRTELPQQIPTLTATGSRFIAGAYRVPRVQVWSEVLNCCCARQAEDALQFEMKERHWIGGQVNLFPG
jgi:hypothetical protein